MKKAVKQQNLLKAMCVGLLVFATGFGAFAQMPNNEVIHQEWAHIGEAPSNIEFSARVVGCGMVNQVMLNLFNENASQQLISFSIRVVNVADGRELTTTFNHTIGAGEMNIAACGDATYDNLKIDLPGDYDAATVTISIIF